MGRLEKSLNAWTQAGFITSQQANQIRNFESQTKGSSWFTTGLYILGIIVIALGIISVIAANWNEIPGTVKLLADFGIMATLSYLTYKYWSENRDVLFDLLLLALFLMSLASIGLISQVYQTGGELYQALILWCAMTAGLAIAAKHLVLPLFWVAALLGGLVLSVTDAEIMNALFQKNYQALFLCFPLFCSAMTIALRTIGGEFPLVKAFRAWSLISGIISLFVVEADVLFLRQHSDQILPYLPGYLLAILAVVGVWKNQSYKHFQKLLILCILGFYILPFHFYLVPIHSKVLYAVCSLGVLSSMAVFLASLGERFLFQVFLGLIALRFLVLYFQALGGLALTGLGLIFSGILVVAMAYLWHRSKAQIAQWAERL